MNVLRDCIQFNLKTSYCFDYLGKKYNALLLTGFAKIVFIPALPAFLLKKDNNFPVYTHIELKEHQMKILKREIFPLLPIHKLHSQNVEYRSHSEKR